MKPRARSIGANGSSSWPSWSPCLEGLASFRTRMDRWTRRLLLDFASEAQLLVYAGAAEGQHLAFLCELFPEIEVEAWDPRPFAPSAVPPEAPENLHVHQEYFTDDVAKDLANRDVPILFVSDIRTANWQVDTTEEHDRRLLADLQAQQRWVEVLHPKRALLKFRFPYTPGCTETLDGELRLPVWGPQTTTECRLLVTPRQEEPHFATKSYDHQCLWEQLFYFNTVTRISIYPRPDFVQEADEAAFKTAGLCRCFDCSREVDLLASYLMQRREVDSSGLAAAVVELARDVSIGCGRGPSGLLDAPKAPWQVQAEKDDAQMPPTKRVKSGSSEFVPISFCQDEQATHTCGYERAALPCRQALLFKGLSLERGLVRVNGLYRRSRGGHTILGLCSLYHKEPSV
ncbi:unnamed protein product [Durusdinium trenchii]|uniref:Cap-specific mRNA (nucleoside-2'-O-)-methyltransferase n=1 Tax=Durusdinium trenchii TaxID=1381693 RepID=A0ABP0P2Z0_9DINO